MNEPSGFPPDDNPTGYYVGDGTLDDKGTAKCLQCGQAWTGASAEATQSLLDHQREMHHGEDER